MDSLKGKAKGLVISTDENNSQSLYQLKANPPLIIVDDEKMPKDFEVSSINANEIESISVLKDKTATDIYGDEGKDGVIIITKKAL